MLRVCGCAHNELSLRQRDPQGIVNFLRVVLPQCAPCGVSAILKCVCGIKVRSACTAHIWSSMSNTYVSIGLACGVFPRIWQRMTYMFAIAESVFCVLAFGRFFS